MAKKVAKKWPKQAERGEEDKKNQKNGQKSLNMLNNGKYLILHRHNNHLCQRERDIFAHAMFMCICAHTNIHTNINLHICRCKRISPHTHT